MTLPDSPWGTFSEVSRTSRAFSPKIARRSRSSGDCSVSPLGVTLPTRMSPGLDLGADAHDAAVVEVGEDLVGQVGDVPGDLLGPELGVAGVDLVLLDVDRGEHVVADQALGQDDGVLVVVALPRHERDQQVLAERELAVLGRGAVGQEVARPRPCRLDDEVRWLIDVSWLERRNLARRYDLATERGGRAVGWPGSYSTVTDSPRRRHRAVALGEQDIAGVPGGAGLDAGPDEGSLGRTSGTACFCMLAPMSARLASSCSMNGISAVETDTICFGQTSMRSTSEGETKSISEVVAV